MFTGTEVLNDDDTQFWQSSTNHRLKTSTKFKDEETSVLLLEENEMITREKFHHCTLCHAKFSYERTLNDHMKIHTGMNRYHCTLCDSKHTHEWYFIKHMKTHSGEKFHCTVCHAKFAHERTLNGHMKIHIGVNSYHCTL